MKLRLRTDGLNWRQIDDEVVVLDGNTANYLAINGSGARLWPALVQGATLQELAEILVDVYKLDGPRAMTDARQFVAALDEQGLMAA